VPEDVQHHHPDMMMTRHHCQNWAALLIVLLGESFVIVAAISCYECNQFPTENRISCPANRTVNYGFQYDVSTQDLLKKQCRP
jgi:hypothetical protein